MNFAAQKAIYDRDIQAIEPEMPQLFYWQGKPYTGQRNEIVDTLTGMDAGYLQEYDFELLVRTSAFPAGVNIPAVNDLLELANPNVLIKKRIEFTIKSAKPSQDGVTITYGIKART